MSLSVGIMSMQRIHNYGSSLQAYGLRRLIETAVEDADVSFVDFEPGPVLVEVDGADVSASRLRRTMSKVAEYNAVEARVVDKLRFFNHKRAYGARHFPMIGVTAAPNRDLHVDVQVIGSDEVFNCVQSNTNVGYSRDLFGYGSPARRLISYAGSFGNTTLAKIDAAGIRAELVSDFARFDAISVRDRNSADIVEELLGQRPMIHVDPVLAHDFMRNESKIPPERLHDRDYIVVYAYSGRLDRAENEALARYARSIDAEILCFGGVQACCDTYVDCNPFELLAYFRDASAVVTDTFHGSIMSIINSKPFGAIIRPSVGDAYGNEEKLGHLLDTFGLTSQRLMDVADVSDVLSNANDYDHVGEVLARERIRSVDYLRSNLV